MRVQVPNGTALSMRFKEFTPGAYSDPIQPDVDHHLRFQFILEHARDIVLFVRADDGRIVEANPAAQTAYGYTYDELLALHITDLRAPE
ncbi:MAG: PAS domain-containing protein, partial [Chloroflexi bacterium]|nr:PAS domain-containing protein [Chloroflexota bacterium]